MTRKASFRPDINGLRAWAVIAVLLFHFRVPGFDGGFVGVDIFFVISGFLMTGIVIRGLEQGQFSVLAFYMARARRIIPALVGVCLVLLLLGWFFLLPIDYKTLGTHSISSLGFFSNIKFWDEAGYFDTASHEKWLLHTWSLSVEWQFYLILPIVLYSIWFIRPGRRTQVLIIYIGIIVSLATSIIITIQQPSMAFFWIHARAWEMLAGGLIYFYIDSLVLSHFQKTWFERLGLLTILGSVFFFDLDSPWPGWRAVFPVLGTMMVIVAGNQSRWTGNSVAQWLGDRSYSIYLWHWPIYVGLVFIDYQNHVPSIIAGFVLTLIVSHLSYLFIENPTRFFLGKRSLVHGVCFVALGGGVVILPAFLVRVADGVNGRFDSAVELAEAEAENINPRRLDCHTFEGSSSPSCVYGGNSWDTIVLGDSHASVMMTSLQQAQAGTLNKGAVQWSYSGCPFVVEIQFTDSFMGWMKKDWKCLDFHDWVEHELEAVSGATPIVIVNRYPKFDSDTKPIVFFSQQYEKGTSEFFSEFGRHIKETACRLADSHEVVLLRPIPEFKKSVPKTLSRRMAMGVFEDISISREAYYNSFSWVWEAQNSAQRECGVKILDPTKFLCDVDRCYGSKDGRPLYIDDNHLSEWGNKYLVPMFAEIYE